MAKRSATTNLNHENWDDADTHEEAGTFQKATPEMIQNRVIKAAKRKTNVSIGSDGNETTSPFANFGGFKPSTHTPVKPTTTFSFLSNSKTSNGDPTPSFTTTSSDKDKTPVADTSKSTNEREKPIDSKKSDDSKTNAYYSKLKGLNESVSKWIKSHVDKNPFCILTPVFDDYNRHLSEIQKNHSITHESKEEVKDDSQKPFPKSSVFSSAFSTSAEASVSFGRSLTSTSSTPGSLFESSTNVTQGQSAFDKKTSESDENGSDTKSEPLSTVTSKTPTFNFGSGSSSIKAPMPSAGFVFGSGSTGFTFQNVSKPEVKEEDKVDENEEEQPPKVDFKPVEEEGAVYSKRCKVFVKKDGAFQERGVGTLFVKPVGEKTQLIVRADTSLGNLLINTLLVASSPIQKMGNNNIMMACLPTPDAKPPPVPILLRVKTSADADEVISTFDKYKK